MTIQQLQYILAAARAGSLNKAAEQLYVTQPTLTGAIREVEEEAKIRIFRRTSRGVIPTEEGEEFLRYARQVLQQYELLQDKYIHTQDRRQKFTVSAQHYSFVTKAFIETVKQYGEGQFDFAIRETKTIDVIRDVGEQRSVIGVLFRSAHNKQVLARLLADNDLEFHKLIDSQAAVYLYRTHPLSQSRSITMEALKPYPCLSFDQGEASSSFLAEEILSEKEYPFLIRTTDRATNLNLMIGLNAYTLCPSIISEDLNGKEFVMIPFEEDAENQNALMEIGYILKRGRVIDEITSTFIHEMKSVIAGK
ncbi:MAG: LysR family transcriptional regulator [Lachnospiraceae bacterium]|nr:LysR family transcriptional regulator [Lachnospiraceae bacterium]